MIPLSVSLLYLLSCFRLGSVLHIIAENGLADCARGH